MRLRLVLAGAALAAAAATAEPLSPPAGVLTLADALRTAHERNPDYQALRNAVAVAELDVEVARSVFRAQLRSRFDTSERTGAEIGTVYEVGMSKLGESGARWGLGLLSSQFGERAMSELRFSYRLPFFGNPASEGVFAVDSAEIEFERQRRVLAIGAEELTAEVVAVYYGVVLAANELTLARSSTDVAEMLAQAVAVRAATGLSTDLDLRRARLHVAETARDAHVAEMTLERHKLQLRAVLGMPHDEPLAVDEAIPALPDVLAWDGLLGRSIEAVETNALARRPELLALAAEIELLERKVEAHAPRVMPPLDVSLQVSLVGEGRRMSDTFDRYEPRIGIGFGMALDQGRRPDFERRRLALRHASAVQARTALEDRVRVEARDAALLLEERLGELAFAREANALADDEYRSIELRHRAGRVTTEQALEAAETHAAARHRELEARISYWVAKHRLDVFAGTDLGWSASAYAAADEWAIPN